MQKEREGIRIEIEMESRTDEKMQRFWRGGTNTIAQNMHKKWVKMEQFHFYDWRGGLQKKKCNEKCERKGFLFLQTYTPKKKVLQCRFFTEPYNPRTLLSFAFLVASFFL